MDPPPTRAAEEPLPCSAGSSGSELALALRPGNSTSRAARGRDARLVQGERSGSAARALATSRMQVSSAVAHPASPHRRSRLRLRPAVPRPYLAATGVVRLRRGTRPENPPLVRREPRPDAGSQSGAWPGKGILGRVGRARQASACHREAAALRRPHRCRRPANGKRGEAENLCGVSPLHVEPFEIEVPERTLSDLRERIRNTRWPPPSPEPGWEQGAELSYVRGLLNTGLTGSTGACRSGG